MFDRYMICADTFRNLAENGQATGFQFGVRIAYYRGLGLSMVEDLAVTVDGNEVPRQQIRFSVGGRAYTLEEMEQEFQARWEFGEIATVTVLRPGGLPRGEHRIDLVEQLRVSYMPFPIQGRDSKVVQVA